MNFPTGPPKRSPRQLLHGGEQGQEAGAGASDADVGGCRPTGADGVDVEHRQEGLDEHVEAARRGGLAADRCADHRGKKFGLRVAVRASAANKFRNCCCCESVRRRPPSR